MQIDNAVKKRSYPQLPNNPTAGEHSGRDDDQEVVRQKLIKELLDSPNWNPFKSVIVDDNCQEEVIDVDDDKLEGLKMAWGEGPYNAVIGALVERKEYNTDGTGDAFDLWNYKEGRKATLGECVDCIFDKVKKLKRFHLTYRSRKTMCTATDSMTQ